MSVKVAKIYKVSIKEQEFELTEKEVGALYGALHHVLGKFPFTPPPPPLPRKFVHGKTAERILRVLEKCPKGADAQEVANLADYSDRYAYKTLHQLTEEGKILRRRVGRKYIFFPLKKEETPPSSVEALSAAQLEPFKGLKKIFDQEERLRREYAK